MNKIAFICMLTVLATNIVGFTDVRAKGKSSSGGYKSYKGGKAIDGDTFRYKGKRYRIQQYDAPEIGQTGSREATLQLQHKIDSGKYRWKPVAKDVYRRTIIKEKKK